MNCEKGDLAIVIGIPETRRAAPHVIGKIVKCVYPFELFGMACWAVDPPFILENGNQAGMYDVGLLPIRDPGEDARDETLQWLDVPSRDEVPA